MYINKLLIIITAILLTCTSLAVKALAVKADSVQEYATLKDKKVNAKQFEKNNGSETTVTDEYLKPHTKK